MEKEVEKIIKERTDELLKIGFTLVCNESIFYQKGDIRIGSTLIMCVNSHQWDKFIKDNTDSAKKESTITDIIKAMNGEKIEDVKIIISSDYKTPLEMDLNTAFNHYSDYIVTDDMDITRRDFEAGWDAAQLPSNDAVEFAQWILEGDFVKCTYTNGEIKYWDDNTALSYTAEELYKIFKQKIK